jgi:glucose 1-dehydrogenase
MTMTGMVAIVTGAGSGIGRATAIRFASEGATVVIAYIDREGAEETLGVIGSSDGAARVHVTDVAHRAEVEALVAGTVESFGGVDFMISNAGVAVTRSFLDTTEEELDLVLGVNLKGVFFCGQAAARAMLQQPRRGHIVNVASTYAEVCAPDNSAYCASKGGVRMLTKAMALELGPLGIRVNAVAPGWIRTGMNPLSDPGEVDQLEAEIPLGRIGAPDDIASVIRFLVSADAGYVNGSMVYADGGWIVR